MAFRNAVPLPLVVEPTSMVAAVGVGFTPWSTLVSVLATSEGVAGGGGGALSAPLLAATVCARSSVVVVEAAEADPGPDVDELRSELEAAHEREERLRAELQQKVEAYERRNQKRTTILARISALKGREPRPGYDELTAEEVRTALRDAEG